MKEFFENILGGITVGKFAASFFFSMIGLFISLLLSTTKRDPNSVRSPIHFSWNFLWCDNTIRIYKSIAITILIIFVSIRFAKELLGTDLTMVYALGVGLGFDQLKERFKTKDIKPSETTN